MIVLGIANSKDSGACLMIDGKIISSINEERLCRKKLTKEFPFLSIDWVLANSGLSIDDVDSVGCGVWKGIDSWEMFPRYIEDALSACTEDAEANKSISDRLFSSIKVDRTQNEIFLEGLRKIGAEDKPLYRCNHHHAHALTAFYFSPFKEAMVLTLDGRGDFCSGSVSVMSRGGFTKLIKLESEFNSLGYFYGWVTKYLGFTPDRHEGKVTGLAAAGDPSSCLHILNKMIKFYNGSIKAGIGNYYKPDSYASVPEIENELKKFSREDIAAAAQKILEDTVVAYATHYLKLTEQKYLCLAGGIFANVLLNMKLRNIPGLQGLYVFPHMGDGGIPAGGAAYATLKMGGKIDPLLSVYLGPEYREEEIADEIIKYGLVPFKDPAFSDTLANHLATGKVIGFFNGRMEFGPRSLGARSIMVQAVDNGINVSLNKRLNRTEFMPFAPVTLEDFAADCYVDWKPEDINPWFMTSCYSCSEKMLLQSPAVVHIDNTARPQLVSKERNGHYYDVLNSYFKATGIPTLINTSFNRHEEPIICTPAEAIEELLAGSIDILGIYPFILESPKQS
jgi:carbamoyltransferase